jgi:hypothetical protein
MTLEDKKRILHLAWTIAVAFFLSNLAFVMAMFFIPTMGADGKPVVMPITMTLGEIQTAMLILGCVALGIKLSEERKTMPSIGFTMMSITQGVIFITYTISLSSHEGLEEVFKVYMSSMFLLIPSMILIAFYSDFPKWLNILGVVACVPLLIENIGYAITGELTQSLMNLDGIGQLLFSITAFFWGLRTIRNAKREIQSIDTTPVEQQNI